MSVTRWVNAERETRHMRNCSIFRSPCVLPMKTNWWWSNCAASESAAAAVASSAHGLGAGGVNCCADTVGASAVMPTRRSVLKIPLLIVPHPNLPVWVISLSGNDCLRLGYLVHIPKWISERCIATEFILCRLLMQKVHPFCPQVAQCLID